MILLLLGEIVSMYPRVFVMCDVCYRHSGHNKSIERSVDKGQRCIRSCIDVVLAVADLLSHRGNVPMKHSSSASSFKYLFYSYYRWTCFLIFFLSGHPRLGERKAQRVMWVVTSVTVYPYLRCECCGLFLFHKITCIAIHSPSKRCYDTPLESDAVEESNGR